MFIIVLGLVFFGIILASLAEALQVVLLFCIQSVSCLRTCYMSSGLQKSVVWLVRRPLFFGL